MKHCPHLMYEEQPFIKIPNFSIHQKWHVGNSPAAFITRYTSKLYDVWTSSVAEKSQFNLQKPLISREQRTRLIAVNFSPQVRLSVSSYTYVNIYRPVPLSNVTLFSPCSWCRCCGRWSTWRPDRLKSFQIWLQTFILTESCCGSMWPIWSSQPTGTTKWWAMCWRWRCPWSRASWRILMPSSKKLRGTSAGQAKVEMISVEPSDNWDWSTTAVSIMQTSLWTLKTTASCRLIQGSTGVISQGTYFSDICTFSIQYFIKSTFKNRYHSYLKPKLKMKAINTQSC